MSEAAMSKANLRQLESPENLRLLVPKCERGIGAVIQAHDSPSLIEGLRVQPVAVWPDDRGYFLEVLRFGQGLAVHYPASSTQISASLSYPGTIKAFHYHTVQTDIWTAAMGMMQVALLDLRKDSHTFGVRNTLYIGDLRPWQLLVPPGIAHGYKVIGSGPAVLVYATDRFYNPQDEGRLPYNDPDLNYDWERQHR